MIKITATFLDEITHDIPSQNWGEKEWESDFKAMKAAGIDTVVIIRAGYKDKIIYPSKALKINADYDLAELFFTLGDRYGMKLYLGTYDSGLYWIKGPSEKEVELSKLFIEETLERYGKHKSFYGWYISQEVGKHEFNIGRYYPPVAAKMRKDTPEKPILISPFLWGRKMTKDFLEPEAYTKEWDKLLALLPGCFDAMAFQVAAAEIYEIADYLKGLKGLADKYKVKLWGNVETFSTELPTKGFYPIDIRDLKRKLEIVEPFVEKVITFEFSHFMSPLATNTAAHNLYKRYLEMVKK